MKTPPVSLTTPAAVNVPVPVPRCGGVSEAPLRSHVVAAPALRERDVERGWRGVDLDRRTVEDDGERLAAALGERAQLPGEAALRARPVAPPAVRARAHHVVAVDQPARLAHAPGAG